MKTSNLVIAILVVLILSVFSYFRLAAKVDSSLPIESMPVNSKEFVWVRMDSLSKGLMDISAGEIKVESTLFKPYVITYHPKKYLLHEEELEGVRKIREHLLESGKGLMGYEEDESKVEISLKKKDGFVYCPVLILDRILYSKNKKARNN